MFIHFKLDNPKEEDVKDDKYRDPDYDKEAQLAEGQDPEEVVEEGRLPILDYESYKDPDFDAEWDSDEEEVSDSDDVGENPLENKFENFGEGEGEDTEEPTGVSTEEEWEEV